MNTLQIAKIKILGFLDLYEVEIPFSGNVKILIGENGLGKTQVLNIIYCILSKRFERLLSYIFTSIEISFEDQSKSTIVKSDLQLSVYKESHPVVGEIIDKLGFEGYLSLREDFNKRKFSKYEFTRTSLARELSEIAPIEFIVEILRNDFVHKMPKSQDIFTSYFSELKEKIASPFKDTQILYFPTFRRVEEDLKNLGYDEEQFKINRDDNRLIHFGMDDVQRRFDAYTERIDKLSKEGFSRLSSEILSQLVRGQPKVNTDLIERIAENDVQIILERIGQQMSGPDKEKIIEMINSKEVLTKDPFLLYFLQNLIDIYDQQREFDTMIKEFVRVCNAYLVNKKVFYDESGLKIYIKNEKSDEKLLLSKLSSGEKQIVSILSKIYLSPKEHKFIVLFDEPELSLSIFWQRKLLPDILSSGKCNFLIAVTHSPFIFENELDQYAISLKEYFTNPN